MAVNIPTPQKISARNPVCMLCGNSYESCRMIRVFGKSGSTKALCSKIHKMCGITISEDDSSSNLICRVCVTFLNKMEQFIQKAQSLQKMVNEERSEYSVKRCIQLSPSLHQPSKRLAEPKFVYCEPCVEIRSKSDDQTSKSITPKRSAKQLSFSTSQVAEVLTSKSAEESSSEKTSSSQVPTVIMPKSSKDDFRTFEAQSLLTERQQKMIVRAVSHKDATVLAAILKEHCPYVVKKLINTVIEGIKATCTKLCRRSQGSVLYGNSYESIKDFDFNKIWDELKTSLPFLVELMTAVSGKENSVEETKHELQVKYSFIYAILMNERWHELNLVKRVNTLLIIEGGCTKQLQERLNKLGVCLSHGRRDTLLKLLGGHFADKVVEKVKSGKVFRGTGDNWDLKVLRDHMRKDIQNEDLHLFASNLIENRISFSHLPNVHPKGIIANFPRYHFSLNVKEWKVYIRSAKTIVGRIILEFFPKFKWLKSVIPLHIPHVYSKEMAQKSTIVNLPLLNANEAKYADCVSILRAYESWIAEIYHKAGILSEMPRVDNPEVPSAPATPGQPNAHRQDTLDDPMREMKVVFAGDQLTRVRFAGAKDLLSGSHTPSDRFEHCSPFKPVMWHTKASLLQYSYSFLHKAESVSQVGTLKYFREKFNRRNATPSKVVDSYEGSEELFLSVGRAYIVTAALSFFGMASTEEIPNKNIFPANISAESEENKKTYFEESFGKFIDVYLLQKTASTDREDYVKNYALCFIFLTILILQLKDTAAEADGERNLINQKLLLSVFKSMGAYSKYALEMFTSIAQIECMLTPRLAEEVKWGFFVNWRGGPGNNIEDDLAQEISNRLSKSIVQRMGSNKTLKSISKVCKATNGIKEVTEQFDASACIHHTSVHHTTRDSLADEKEMIADLVQLDPFRNIPGRCHESFPEIKSCPLKYLNIVDFHQWLDKHKWELSNTT